MNFKSLFIFLKSNVLNKMKVINDKEILVMVLV